ncbi:MULTISPECIES: hypothetical protein [unclassified Streptomyces]|uniref:hypothetical protein n=1 Tax=unclassified Streptomyces TaxID=2593676 RepID=UPI003829FBDF
MGQKISSGAAVSTVLALTIALSLPQHAQTATAAPSSGPPGSGSISKLAKAEENALTEAAHTGEPVEVLPQRTETSQVFANPSGTFTRDSYAMPQWTRQGHKLVDIDTGLVFESGGRIKTKATEIGVSFSGGGNDALVTVVRDGRSLSLKWPTELPKPTVSEDTATYPEVLPGVDLKLKADNSGFSHLLVVKSAEAAANPQLRSIGLGLATDGLDVAMVTATWPPSIPPTRECSSLPHHACGTAVRPLLRPPFAQTYRQTGGRHRAASSSPATGPANRSYPSRSPTVG